MYMNHMYIHIIRERERKRCIHLSLSLSIYIYIYIYVCMYVYIYIYIYILHVGERDLGLHGLRDGGLCPPRGSNMLFYTILYTSI